MCFLEEDYVLTNSPQPLPTMIDITIEINAINEVDEEKQAVELSLKIVLDWQDNRLSVNRSEEDFNKYIHLEPFVLKLNFLCKRIR